MGKFEMGLGWFSSMPTLSSLITHVTYVTLSYAYANLKKSIFIVVMLYDLNLINSDGEFKNAKKPLKTRLEVNTNLNMTFIH